MKLIFLLRRYFYYYRKLGWQGINIFKRLNESNKPFIKVKLNSIQSTIHLRSNSSDVIAFEHIFLQNQYNDWLKIHCYLTQDILFLYQG